MGETDRQTDGRTTASLNASYFDGGAGHNKNYSSIISAQRTPNSTGSLDCSLLWYRSVLQLTTLTLSRLTIQTACITTELHGVVSVCRCIVV